MTPEERAAAIFRLLHSEECSLSSHVGPRGRTLRAYCDECRDEAIADALRRAEEAGRRAGVEEAKRALNTCAMALSPGHIWRAQHHKKQDSTYHCPDCGLADDDEVADPDCFGHTAECMVGQAWNALFRADPSHLDWMDDGSAPSPWKTEWNRRRLAKGEEG